MNKIISLDILRIFSIFMIIFGHICHATDNTSLAWYLGYTFVDVFFILSAILLSEKYSNQILNWQNFGKKRIFRIIATYYPFLIISFIILILINEPASIKTIFSHLFFVNYFTQDSISGQSFGHLWFMSMIIFCYIVVLLSSKVPFIRKLYSKKFIIIPIAITMVIGFLSLKLHIPNRIILVFSFFIFFFFYGKDVINYFKEKSCILTVIIWFLLNSITVYLFYHQLDSHIFLRDWIVLFSSISWIALFLSVFSNVRNFSMITFLSGISFEMYLVHHPFILGKFSLFQYYDKPTAIILVFFLTISLAYILSILGNYTYKLLTKTSTQQIKG